MRPLQILGALCIGFTSGACLPLQAEPWAYFREGDVTVDLSTGLSKFDADVLLRGRDSLAGTEGSKRSKLEPEYLIAARGRSFVTDHWLLGGGLDWSRYRLPGTEIAGLRVSGEPFSVTNYVVDTRYLFDPLAAGGRLTRMRPFLGAEVFYVADVDIDFQVGYGDAANTTESIPFRGHGYYGYGLVGGVAVQLTDDTLLELGGRWAQNFGGSDAEVLANPPGGGPSSLLIEFDPEGWLFFLELTYSF
jgi:hypothetical protein